MKSKTSFYKEFYGNFSVFTIKHVWASYPSFKKLFLICFVSDFRNTIIYNRVEQKSPTVLEMFGYQTSE